ncbi:acyltransferase family protein [Corynebacterium variabile]|uniref:acyltransferase family protein n=2 Tax=Corynebacterium variabile TaxID=1727 RepID=UPI003FCF1AA8
MTSDRTIQSTPVSATRPRSAHSAGRHRRMSGRNLPVDTLRGIACILLVTFHVIGDKSTAGIHVADDSVFRWYCDSVQYLRMPLFIFLSGLVYAWRPLSDISAYPAFMRKKARRLLVPYVIFVPAIGVTQSMAPEVNSTIDTNPLLWLINSLSPYWFLLSTFWLFAVVALLDSVNKLHSPWFFGVLFAAVTIISLVSSPEDFETLQLGTALSFFPFFLAGIAAVRFQLIPRRLWIIVLTASVVIALMVVVQFSLAGYLGPIETRHSVMGIAIGILFPIVFLSLSLSSRSLAWIGGYSSGIYLLHPFAIGFFRASTSAAGIDADLPRFIILSLGGLFASILGIIVLRHVRIGPAQIGKFILGEKAGK